MWVMICHNNIGGRSHGRCVGVLSLVERFTASSVW